MLQIKLTWKYFESELGSFKSHNILVLFKNPNFQSIRSRGLSSLHIHPYFRNFIRGEKSSQIVLYLGVQLINMNIIDKTHIHLTSSSKILESLYQGLPNWCSLEVQNSFLLLQWRNVIYHVILVVFMWKKLMYFRSPQPKLRNTYSLVSKEFLMSEG